MQNILEELNKICRDVFDDENLIVTETTTANDVEDWDSISHIRLLFSIEKHFKVKFTSAEIGSFKNIGEIVTCLSGKL